MRECSTICVFVSFHVDDNHQDLLFSDHIEKPEVADTVSVDSGKLPFQLLDIRPKERNHAELGIHVLSGLVVHASVFFCRAAYSMKFEMLRRSPSAALRMRSYTLSSRRTVTVFAMLLSLFICILIASL